MSRARRIASGLDRWRPRVLEGASERPWSVAEAAEWLGRSPEWVRSAARRGELRTLGKVGREWRFDPADVRALLRPAEKLPRALARAILAKTDGVQP